jgi:UDP-N-acetylglucosamine 2-epimerase (non-hydrolysing)
MLHIGICFGTRPEYLKLIPFANYLTSRNVKHKLYYIHQHTSILESMPHNVEHVFVDSIASNRLNQIGASILTNLEKVWDISHSHCVVQGDTSTALFSALFAFHRQCKIVHIEAGLRTYDLTQPYPEEANRQMISRIASFHFVPHEDCKKYLLNEQIKDNLFCVGNTILDLIDSYKLNPSITKNVLITFHRRENWDKLPIFIESLKQVIANNPSLHFTWCMHPNPVLQKTILESFDNDVSRKSISLSSPLPHKELTEFLAKSHFIITDSGGIQEEASFLGKTCIVLRESTERNHIPEPYIYLCKDISTLASLVGSIGFEQQVPCNVYGNGTASQQILSILERTHKVA